MKKIGMKWSETKEQVELNCLRRERDLYKKEAVFYRQKAKELEEMLKKSIAQTKELIDFVKGA